MTVVKSKKKYRLQIQRTETRQAELDVYADCEDTAHDQGEDKAGNIDFNGKEVVSVEHQVVSVEEQIDEDQLAMFSKCMKSQTVIQNFHEECMVCGTKASNTSLMHPSATDAINVLWILGWRYKDSDYLQMTGFCCPKKECQEECDRGD